MKDGLKICTIGGGSSYTPELMNGFIKRYDRLPIKEIWLVDVERGRDQYAEFCKLLVKRIAGCSVTVVIEPLRPNETDIIHYVWQGLQIVEEVDSPRLRQLADIFHMMMGREPAESIVKAGDRLMHCHIAEWKTRKFPGHDPEQTYRLKPYFDALKEIGYAGGVSCECGWGEPGDLAKNLETALKTMKGLI